MCDVFPVNLAWLGWGVALLAQIFPQDSWEAVGIIFLGRFCYLGPNDGLHSHSILAMCCPCPSPHPLYTGQLVLYFLYCRESLAMWAFCMTGTPRTRWAWKIFRLSIAGYVASHLLFLVPSFLFLGNGKYPWRALAHQLAVGSWWEPSRTVEGSAPYCPCPALNLNLCLLYSSGTGVEEISVLIRFYKIILLCTMPS